MPTSSHSRPSESVETSPATARSSGESAAAPLLSPAFVRLCVAAFFGALAPNLFVIVPRHLRALGMHEREIGAVMGAFPLASLFATPLAARLADRLGRRALVAGGMFACAVGCVTFELGRTFVPLLVLRGLQGAAWSGVLVGCSLYAAELAPPGRLAQALGAAGVLTLVAMAVGPALGEALVAGGSFRWLFRAAGATGAVGALLATGLPCLVPPSGARDDDGSRDGGLLSAFDVGTRAPLIGTALVATGFGAVVAFLADYGALAGIGGVSPFFGSYVASAILARLSCGSLSDRVGRLRVIVPACAGQALALGGLATLSARWQLWPLGVLFGFTHGLYYPALQALVLERQPPGARARAVASASFAFSLGMAVSAFGNGAVARATGYPTVYAIVAGAAALAIVVLVWDPFRSGPGRKGVS